jgi:NADPH2:quinone reductase
MQGAIDLMAVGHVKAPTPTLLPLAEARQAHVLLDSGMTTGKIVLQP